MRLTLILCTVFVVLVSAGLHSSSVLAGDAAAYEAAKEKSRGHVGIHQRRDAYREYVAGDAEGGEAIANIEPAAGDEDLSEDAGQMEAQAAAPVSADVEAVSAPRYNQ